MSGEQTQQFACNACGKGEEEHTLVVGFEHVFGATVWVYDDGYARVVPWWTTNNFDGEVMA